VTRNKATLIGLVAIGLWSTVIGLIRVVSEHLGPTGGGAMIYTVASVFLMLSVGIPKIKEFPRPYLYLGSGLFAAYELCLVLAIGDARNGRQAIEVSMLNYLWPTLTMLLSIVVNKQRSNLLIVPGVALSLLGVCWVLGGDNGLELAQMATNIRGNPAPYVLAFVGAVIWSTYCTVTSRISGGKNGVTLFFLLTAVVLWCKFAMEGGGSMTFTTGVCAQLALTACALGIGHACWNIGILKGNVTLLAGASYFTPILSAAMASALLGSKLSNPFWVGAAMVCAGSLLSWTAIREGRPG